MSRREIDLQPETYYDCENGVYDLFTQYDIGFKRYKLQSITVQWVRGKYRGKLSKAN